MSEVSKRCREKLMAHQARRAAILRGEDVDAKPAANVRAKPTKDTEAHAKGDGQAIDTAAQHEQRGVEADTRDSAGEGRVQVPRVRKASGGKAGAR